MQRILLLAIAKIKAQYDYSLGTSVVFLLLSSLFLITFFSNCDKNSESINVRIDSVFVSTMELKNIVQLDSVHLKLYYSANKIIGFRNYYKTNFLEISQMIIKPKNNKESEIKIYYKENSIIEELDIFQNTETSSKDISTKIYNETLKNLKIDIVDESLNVNSLRINQVERIKLKIKKNRI